MVITETRWLTKLEIFITRTFPETFANPGLDLAGPVLLLQAGETLRSVGEHLSCTLHPPRGSPQDLTPEAQLLSLPASNPV